MDALCHLGLGKFYSRHIAHCDVIKAANNVQRLFVQKVPATVIDLGVKGPAQSKLVSPLSFAQSFFKLAVVPWVLDLFSVRQSRQFFEPQINANTVVHRPGGSVRNLNADVEKPVASRVTAKAGAVLDAGTLRNSSALEHLKLTPVEVKPGRRFFNVPTLQRNPAQMLLAPITQVGPFLLSARLGILLANCVDRAGVNTKLLAAACGELVQVKAGKPFTTEAKGVLLAVVAVVKHKVHRARLLVQQTIEAFDTVSVHEQHTVIISSNTGNHNPFQRCALALYLPALKDRVSREF
jgi:hypothetical protein